MHTLFAEYLERLQTLHADLSKALAGLSTEALDWVPGDNIPSIGVLATHIAGSERYWIGDVIARDSSGRDRAAEFRSKAIDATELLQRLDAAFIHSQNVVAELNLDDLETHRTAPRDGRVVTVAWALAHALEHGATHLGHIQILRQLWEQRLPA